MKTGLPKLNEISDIRKYLLIIETLELERLNNVLVHPTPLREQAQVTEDLTLMKAYHTDMTDFLIRKQNEHRMNEFELSCVTETQEFLQFWTRVIDNFKEVSNQEIERTIDRNEQLKDEFNELMEKHLGFRPPANPTFLNLQAIRKIVAKLRLNDGFQFINFDYFKKINIRLNEDWLRDRRLTIVKKMDAFEKRLNEALRTLQERLALELQKLHVKRLRQFDQLLVRQQKIKNQISELNAKEKIELKKMQNFYHNRVAVTTFFHKNDLFLKGMMGREDGRWGELGTAVGTGAEMGRETTEVVATGATGPISILKAKGDAKDRAATPGKNFAFTMDGPDRSVKRAGRSQRMTSAVINFGPKNNEFGSELFLGEIDVAQRVKEKKRKTVKL